MNDLQCPARIILARHGTAAAPTGGTAPSTDAGLTDEGRAQARGLADRLEGERVAAVWSSTLPRARETALVVASELALTVREDPRLVELVAVPGAAASDAAASDAAASDAAASDADDTYRRWLLGDLSGTILGESGGHVLGRISDVIGEASDLARGETTVMITHGGIIGLAVATRCREVSAADVLDHPLRPADTVLLEVDSGGWRCGGWPRPTGRRRTD